ncbi:alpha/beta fold hydrolase [Saccharopolyspora sp. ASAGF58]|uniref:alpha/beta fold hydrolase n=1 Tax=Saccharopolyspora sp. ASAGF58 TaxID=2719023 RepID=UPI00143FBAB8|nr:alpha/beta fold hydrolase [Saccharopolyspora sp. ASAGF58]QIZ37795.1 alpha/beta hydrolase [Saccharopolyspora sp. ASAGF58]
MPFVESSPHRFYYRRWGLPEPRAGVVLLHGRGEHSGLYHRFAGDLNHHGIEVWGIDHLGHGHTGGDPDGCSDFTALATNAGELVSIAADQRPGLPLVVVGHSLGGLTAAVLQARSAPPIEALVLSGTLLEREIGHRARLAEQGEPVMSEDPAYLDALAVDPLLSAAGEPDAQRLDRAILEALQTIRTAAPQWTLPVLFVNGENDVVARPEVARRWAERMQRASFTEMARAHHDVLNDLCHREVADFIAKFVLEHTSATAGSA